MEEKQRKLYVLLMVIFWSNILLVIITFLILLRIVGLELSNTYNVIFERYSIIFTFAAIPVALKLFQWQQGKTGSMEQDIFLKKYFKLYILRLSILDAAIILNMVGLYSFKSQNAVYMILIILLTLIFCNPSMKALNGGSDEIKENNNTNNA